MTGFRTVAVKVSDLGDRSSRANTREAYIMEHHNVPAGDQVDRRRFIKRAGTVAWTIPAMQVVNMTGALAGASNTSVTGATTVPPAPPGGCEEVYYRLKAAWASDGWVWLKGSDEGDCFTEGEWADLIPNDLPVTISGDAERAVVEHELADCEIYAAAHSEGGKCVEAEIGDAGAYAKFESSEDGIAQIELLVKCCVYPG